MRAGYPEKGSWEKPQEGLVTLKRAVGKSPKKGSLESPEKGSLESPEKGSLESPEKGRWAPK